MNTAAAIIDALEKQIGDGCRLAHFTLDMGEPVGDQPPGGDTRWHQIALEGEWSGHWLGAFKLTAEHFEQMSFNFDQLNNDTLVDYEHSSLNPFLGKAPAAGWINAMQPRMTDQGAALFARVNWTPNATAHIQSREYRYLSPTIMFRTRDRQSGADVGASIHSVALTNTPFLDELPEVRLNSLAQRLVGNPPTIQQRKEAMNKEQLKKLAKQLGLSADASAETILEAAARFAADASALQMVANAIGADEGADGAAIVEAVNQRSSVPTGHTTILLTDLATLRASASTSKKLRAESLIARATQAGKIVEQNRDWATALAESDPDAFEQWETSAPAVVPTTVVQPANRTTSGGSTGPSDAEIDAKIAELTDAERANVLREGIDLRAHVRNNWDFF
jgi:phage I-like protein